MIPTTLNQTPRLCYIHDAWAFFTTQALDKQRGDDWNDRYYESNAGPPYRPPPGADWQLYKLAFHCYDLTTPDELQYMLGPLSVDEINAGAAPWLQSWPPTEYTSRPYKNVRIPAGTSLASFVRTIRKAGGAVYLPFNGDAKLLRYGFPSPLTSDED